MLHNDYPNQVPRSTYHHLKMLAKNFDAYDQFVMGTTNGDGNLKAFSAKNCGKIAVMIMNQYQTSKTIDVSFTSAYTTTGTNKIKLNIGNALPFTTSMGAEETRLFIFDPCGRLLDTQVYNETTASTNGDPSTNPQTVLKKCRCYKTTLATNPVLRCAVSTETGTVHYNSTTLRTNLRIKDSAYVTGTLIVPSGLTLTIDTAEVSFGTNAKIEVQSGGKLIINDSHLHDCPGNKWAGINITGDGSTASFTINNSVVENATVAITSDNSFKPAITTNVFMNCAQGIRINAGSQFNISENEFTGVQNCIKTSNSDAGASYISENLFYEPDTAVIFKDDHHTQLTVSCNAFVEYRYYGIYATGGSLKDQGTDHYGPGNYFGSPSTNTNHQLYFTGSSGMIYYPDPIYNFTLSLSSPMTATATTSGENATCESISARLAHYGINTDQPHTISYSSSRIINCVPNPANDKAMLTYIIADKAKYAEIKISNLFGETVKNIPVSIDSKSVETNFSDLDNGIYIYSLVVNGSIVDSKKVIVSK